MVKNGLGGNKAKKNASKNFNINDRAIRYSQCDDEKYAVVQKILGNNMCQVLCIDGKERQCVIRGKFSGKGKRNNRISKGTWILIGLREWEVSSKDRCDLLEVYNENDKQKIIKNENYDFNGFLVYSQDEQFDDNLNFISNTIEDLDNDNISKKNENEYFIFESDSDDLEEDLNADNHSSDKLVDLDDKNNLNKTISKFGEIDIDEI